MNVNLGGIKNKLMNKAEYVAFLVSAYERFDGDLSTVSNHFLKGGAIREVTKNIGDLDLLKHKLWDSEHGYTGIFKMGVYAYIAAELGLLDKKYKKTIEKVLWGSGLAAVVLPGHGGASSGSSGGSSGGGQGW